HCANIYHKSLLYLVSNAFEEHQRIPIFRKDGEKILGMEKFVEDDKDLMTLFKGKRADWVKAPNTEVETPNSSSARHHGDFDDDQPTLEATLMHILGATVKSEFTIHRSAASLSARRRQLV
ncbi:MAG TPA: peptidase C1, partial [Blastocatellia bacterium]|nr:peptidase C1 [Blastocatellia bacterium]